MNGLLLDSHILLWWATRQLDRLPVYAQRAIAEADQVVISVATVWELEIKHQTARLGFDPPDWQALSDNNIAIVPIEVDDALSAARLPLIHRDPFDRMIVAQTMRRGLTLVTADGALADYGVAILKA